MNSKGMFIAAGLLTLSSTIAFADNGLITKPSKYSVTDTIEKFEAAVKAKSAAGWVIFSRMTTPLRQRRLDWKCAREPSSFSAIRKAGRR